MNVFHAGTVFVNHRQCALAVAELPLPHTASIVEVLTKFCVWKALTSPQVLHFVKYTPLHCSGLQSLIVHLQSIKKTTRGKLQSLLQIVNERSLQADGIRP